MSDEPTVEVPASAVRFAADELERDYYSLDLEGDHAALVEETIEAFRDALEDGGGGA